MFQNPFYGSNKANFLWQEAVFRRMLGDERKQQQWEMPIHFNYKEYQPRDRKYLLKKKV
jgi:hypothetical protein